MLEYAKTLKEKSPQSKISHQHRSNAQASLMGVDVTLNSRGHRSVELENPKKVNEKRIHFLGSSISLGWGVPVEDGFVSIVESRLNKNQGAKNGNRYVAINAGVGNYNTYYQVEAFKKQLADTDPDLVVLQYYINDAEPNPQGENNIILEYSVFAAFVYQHIKTISASMSKSLDGYYSNLHMDGQPGWEQAKASIRELKAICEARNILLIAVLVPELHDFSKDGPYPPLYGKIKKVFEEAGIPLVNTFPAMATAFNNSHEQAWIARDDPHPNARAHQVLADELYKGIKALEF